MPLVGMTVPLPEPTAVVNWYCVVKLAVYVVAMEGTVMVCEIAPLSDQLLKAYWMPVPPDCGEVVAIVWVEF